MVAVRSCGGGAGVVVVGGPSSSRRTVVTVGVGGRRGRVVAGAVARSSWTRPWSPPSVDVGVAVVCEVSVSGRRPGRALGSTSDRRRRRRRERDGRVPLPMVSADRERRRRGAERRSRRPRARMPPAVAAACGAQDLRWPRLVGAAGAAPPSSATSATAVLRPVGRALGERRRGDALEQRRRVRPERRTRAAAGRSRCIVASARASARLERQPPGEHPEQDHAERVDVARGRRRLARGLLRRDVGGGAEHRPDRGQAARVADPGDPEVGDLRAALGVEQDVRRLQVAVDDARGVRVGEPGGDLGGDALGLAVRKRPAGASRSSSDPPGRYSSTMNGRPSASP